MSQSLSAAVAVVVIAADVVVAFAAAIVVVRVPVVGLAMLSFYDFELNQSILSQFSKM